MRENANIVVFDLGEQFQKVSVSDEIEEVGLSGGVGGVEVAESFDDFLDENGEEEDDIANFEGGREHAREVGYQVDVHLGGEHLNELEEGD